MPGQTISTDKAPKPPVYFSQGIVNGDMVFCQGMTGADPVTGQIIEGTVQDRTTRAMKNIEGILGEAGMDLTDLMSVTIYLSSYNEDFKLMNAAYVAAFPEGHTLPPRACVGVACLPMGTDVEIQCIAKK